MYTGADTNLKDLQTQITALTGRVNAIDGQGLADPTQAVLTQHSNKINGLRTDLRQVTAKLEQILNDYKTTVLNYLTTIKQHLGIS